MITTKPINLFYYITKYTNYKIWNKKLPSIK